MSAASENSAPKKNSTSCRRAEPQRHDQRQVERHGKPEEAPHRAPRVRLRCSTGHGRGSHHPDAPGDETRQICQRQRDDIDPERNRREEERNDRLVDPVGLHGRGAAEQRASAEPQDPGGRGRLRPALPLLSHRVAPCGGQRHRGENGAAHAVRICEFDEPARVDHQQAGRADCKGRVGGDAKHVERREPPQSLKGAQAVLLNHPRRDRDQDHERARLHVSRAARGEHSQQDTGAGNRRAELDHDRFFSWRMTSAAW